jgi:hypothetical protein
VSILSLLHPIPDFCSPCRYHETLSLSGMPFLTILEIDVSHIEVLGALLIFGHGNCRRSVGGGGGVGDGGWGEGGETPFKLMSCLLEHYVHQTTSYGSS